MQDKREIEARLEKIVDIMENSSQFIDKLDIAIPGVAKEAILKILHSDHLNDIVQDIKTRRPPRIVIMGRSGVGKSSLINAMFGAYLAETSAIEVGTESHEFFQYKKNGEIVFEIIDTRGIKENINTLHHSAEDNLVQVIDDFNPDAFLFLTNGADRSGLQEDTAYLKELFTALNIHPPLITVITKVDAIEPARIINPSEYTELKINRIQDRKRQVKHVLEKAGLSNTLVVPVSTYLEWSHESPESLPEEEREQLTITFDGRYNIDELLDTLENNIDFNAALDMMLHHEIDQAMEKIANHFVKSFSNASFLVGVTPMPGMDITILLPIQIIEVIVITYLSGNKADVKSAREFILSLGAVFLFGFGLRFVAQQGTKLLNVVPGAGSALSGAIAYSGTYSIGKAAIAYYIKGESMAEAKKIAEKAKKESESIENNSAGDHSSPSTATKESSTERAPNDQLLLQKNADKQKHAKASTIGEVANEKKVKGPIKQKLHQAKGSFKKATDKLPWPKQKK